VDEDNYLDDDPYEEEEEVQSLAVHTAKLSDEQKEQWVLRADFAYRVSSYSTGFYSRLRASMSYSLYAESLP
jgi:hypothetical protein